MANKQNEVISTEVKVKFIGDITDIQQKTKNILGEAGKTQLPASSEKSIKGRSADVETHAQKALGMLNNGIMSADDLKALKTEIKYINSAYDQLTANAAKLKNLTSQEQRGLLDKGTSSDLQQAEYATNRLVKKVEEYQTDIDKLTKSYNDLAAARQKAEGELNAMPNYTKADIAAAKQKSATASAKYDKAKNIIDTYGTLDANQHTAVDRERAVFQARMKQQSSQYTTYASKMLTEHYKYSKDDPSKKVWDDPANKAKYEAALNYGSQLQKASDGRRTHYDGVSFQKPMELAGVQGLPKAEETEKLNKEIAQYTQHVNELSTAQSNLKKLEGQKDTAEQDYQNKAKAAEDYAKKEQEVAAAVKAEKTASNNLANAQKGADKAISPDVAAVNRYTGAKGGMQFDANELLQGTQEVSQMREEIEKTTQAFVQEKEQGIAPLTEQLNQAQGANATLQQDIGQITATNQALARQNSLYQSMGERLAYFFSFYGMWNTLTRLIRNAYQAVKELDAAMTETAVVTTKSVSDMWTTLADYTDQANELGVSIAEVYEASTLYYQQGLKTNEVTALTAQTLKMARIAGLDAAEATDRVTNALRGFNMEITEASATRITDVYSAVAASSASNVDELSTAMTKVASLASNAGMSYENTTAFLAQIIETTRESADTAGTALKTVIARFSEVKDLYSEGELTGTEEESGTSVDVNRIQTALKAAGVDMTQYFLGNEGLDEVLMELASKWENLDTITQRYIATEAAGSRQQSRFIALMQDYNRMMELTETANNAAGASEEQFGKTLESLESKLSKLSNAWTEFTTGLFNSDIIKNAVGALTGLLNAINDLLNKMSFGQSIVRTFISGFAVWKTMNLGGDLANMFKAATMEASAQGTKLGTAFAKQLGAALSPKALKTKMSNFWTSIVGNKAAMTTAAQSMAHYTAAISSGSIETEILAETSMKNLSVQEQAAILTGLQTNNIDKETVSKILNSDATDAQKTADLKKIAADELERQSMNKGIVVRTQETLTKWASSWAEDSLIRKLYEGIAASIAKKTADEGLATAQTAVAVTGAAAAISIGLIVIAITMAIVAIVCFIKLMDNLIVTNSEYSETAQEAYSDAAEAADEATSAYEELLDAIESYNDTEVALDILTKGTTEWKEKVDELRSSINEILEVYPQLAEMEDALQYNEDTGLYEFTKEALEKAQAVVEEETANTEIIEAFAKIKKDTADVIQVGDNEARKKNQGITSEQAQAALDDLNNGKILQNYTTVDMSTGELQTENFFDDEGKLKKSATFGGIQFVKGSTREEIQEALQSIITGTDNAIKTYLNDYGDQYTDEEKQMLVEASKYMDTSEYGNSDNPAEVIDSKFKAYLSDVTGEIEQGLMTGDLDLDNSKVSKIANELGSKERESLNAMEIALLEKATNYSSLQANTKSNFSKITGQRREKGGDTLESLISYTDMQKVIDNYNAMGEEAKAVFNANKTSVEVQDLLDYTNALNNINFDNVIAGYKQIIEYANSASAAEQQAAQDVLDQYASTFYGISQANYIYQQFVNSEEKRANFQDDDGNYSAEKILEQAKSNKTLATMMDQTGSSAEALALRFELLDEGLLDTTETTVDYMKVLNKLTEVDAFKSNTWSWLENFTAGTSTSTLEDQVSDWRETITNAIATGAYGDSELMSIEEYLFGDNIKAGTKEAAEIAREFVSSFGKSFYGAWLDLLDDPKLEGVISKAADGSIILDTTEMSLTDIAKEIEEYAGVTQGVAEAYIADLVTYSGDAVTTQAYNAIMELKNLGDDADIESFATSATAILKDKFDMSAEEIEPIINQWKQEIYATGDSALYTSSEMWIDNLLEMLGEASPIITAFAEAGSQSLIDYDKAWTNSFDELYNLAARLNTLAAKRNVLQKQYTKELESANSSYQDLIELQDKEMSNLKSQQLLTNQKLAARTQQAANIKNLMYYNSTSGAYSSYEQAGVTRYATLNAETGEVNIDWDALEAIETKAEGEAAKSYIEKLEEVGEDIQKLQEESLSIQEEQRKLLEESTQEGADLYETIKDTIVDYYQQQIDSYQTLADAISDSNTKILNNLREEIDYQRQIRDNTKKEEELAEKEQRLAYLKRDTSGANDLEIYELEKELSDAYEEYSDSIVDQSIDNLEQQMEDDAEWRSEQIELMQSQLNYQQESGQIWKTVEGYVQQIVDGNTDTFKALYKMANNINNENWIAQLIDEQKLGQTINEGIAGIASAKITEAQNKGSVQLGNGGTATYDSNTQSWVYGNNTGTLSYDLTSGTYNFIKADDTYGTYTAPAAEDTTTTELLTQDQLGMLWGYFAAQNNGNESPGMTRLIQNYIKRHASAMRDVSYSKVAALGAEYQKYADRLPFATIQHLYSLLAFKSGGLADFTGPAWLDGTPSNPELVLSADDTRNFLALRDTLAAANTGNVNGDNGDNYFDINIVVDSIGSDYDVDQLADKIKEQIYDDATYRNVTAIQTSH